MLGVRFAPYSLVQRFLEQRNAAVNSSHYLPVLFDDACVLSTWEPGALRVALNLGGQATAGGALQLPFPSL